MHALAVLLQAQPDIQTFQRIMAVMVPVMIFAYLFIVALVMVPCWFICKKAGFSPWVALACIIPSLGTLVLLYVLAFADWKVMPVPPQAYWPPQPPYQPPPVPPVAPQA